MHLRHDRGSLRPHAGRGGILTGKLHGPQKSGNDGRLDAFSIFGAKLTCFTCQLLPFIGCPASMATADTPSCPQ